MGNILSPNTVFEKCLGLLDLQNFRCPYSDTYAKKLLTGTTILLLIDAQLRGLASLPDVEMGLRANDKLQTFVCLDSIHASSLYREDGAVAARYIAASMLPSSRAIESLASGQERNPKSRPLKRDRFL